MLEQRNGIPKQEREVQSGLICQQLWELILSSKARVIHSYLTMGSEVNILPLLQKALEAGLTVVVPKTLRKRQIQNLVLHDLRHMEPGIFGTYHPEDSEEYLGKYDLVIVAGLAFDPEGYRVGYGGGYYDTFLATQQFARKIGVLYPFQLVEKVPREAHDIPVDVLLTGRE